MFAPHCPTCRRRVLLGTDQLVRFTWEAGRRVAVLRCSCGELLDWNQQPPADEADQERTVEVTSSATVPAQMTCALVG